MKLNTTKSWHLVKLSELYVLFYILLHFYVKWLKSVHHYLIFLNQTSIPQPIKLAITIPVVSPREAILMLNCLISYGLTIPIQYMQET